MGPNPHSPIGFLKEISVAIPKDVVVDLMKFEVGAAPTANYSSTELGTVSLTFYVANAQATDRLLSLLEPKMPGVKKSDAQEITMPDGSKRWKAPYTGKPTEDAYGK